MRNIQQTYHIRGPVDAVWAALVLPKQIAVWSGARARMSARVGGRFSLWGGDVHGKNIAVVPKKKLVQEWFGGDWSAPSKVTFTLASEKGGTRLRLVQTGVPAAEVHAFADGWKLYYLGPLQAQVERQSAPRVP